MYQHQRSFCRDATYHQHSDHKLEFSALAADDPTVTYIVQGTNFAPSSVVVVGTTPAYSTIYVDSTTLHIQGPAQPSGTYNITVVGPDSKSTMVPDALTYEGFSLFL